MKSNLNLKEAMDTAAENKPQLRLVKTPVAVDTAILTGDALRLDQYRRQKEMLEEALKNATVAPTEKMLAKQNQPVGYTADVKEKIAQQAARQENGGSIFSSAFYHI